MCYFIVGNKIFCFFKKRVFVFLGEGTFQGGAKFSKIMRGVTHKAGVQQVLNFFGEALGKRCEVNISGWG